MYVDPILLSWIELNSSMDKLRANFMLSVIIHNVGIIFHNGLKPTNYLYPIFVNPQSTVTLSL